MATKATGAARSATKQTATKKAKTKAAAKKVVVATKTGSAKAGARKANPKSAPVSARPATKKSAAKRAKTAPAAPADPLGRIRALCLGLPEAHEVEAWGEPTFRVKNKIFAMHSSASTHHGGGRQGIWINSDHTTQDLLLRAKPERYFKPPYVGPSGWVGAWLDGKPDWNEITELLREGYRKRAPKKLTALLDDE